MNDEPVPYGERQAYGPEPGPTGDTSRNSAPRLPKLPEITHQPTEHLFNRDNHRWTQHGTSIDCTTCDTPHGFSVSPDTILIGQTDQASPLFRSMTKQPTIP